MKQLPAISVLIPTHDRPGFLREAIGSVLANGFDDFEIVVSDDGVKESAEAVARSFGDGRIRYVRKEPPSSKPMNWSHAARQARGLYLFKLDDDDLIRPGFLRKCFDFLEARPMAGSVYTAARLVFVGEDRIDEMVDCEFFAGREVVDGRAYARAVLLNEGGYPRNQKTIAFYRRGLAEALGFYDHASEDFVHSAALGFLADVGYIPEILYEWRIHGGNGIRDLVRSYAISDEAVSGLLQSPLLRNNPALDREWRPALERCRRALPLFYVHAAFVSESVVDGWKVFAEVRRHVKRAVGPAMVAMLVYGTVVPKFLRRKLLAVYQKGGPLACVIRAVCGLVPAGGVGRRA